MSFLVGLAKTALKIAVTTAAEEGGKEIGKKIPEMGGKILEIVKQKVENPKSPGDGVSLKLDEIKNRTPEQLQEKTNEIRYERSLKEYNEGDRKQREELTDEERKSIKEQSGWSDTINEEIGSKKEYEIYQNADLMETEIDEKKCLIRKDIDWNQKDAMGRTNQERAEQGLAPLDKDGKAYELHHIGQHKDSPLAELTQEEHRGKGNDAILHDKLKETEIDRNAFDKERMAHWQDRANEGGNR